MSDLCAMCGIPVDAQPFDDASFAAAPKIGQEVELASFTLPPRYCGVIQYFSQYTEIFAEKPIYAETPGLVWSLRSNDRPLHPYTEFSMILNPWGYGSFQTCIRIEDSARVSLVVRGTGIYYLPNTNVIISPGKILTSPGDPNTVPTGPIIQPAEPPKEGAEPPKEPGVPDFRASPVQRVGGRLVGRYWYNRAFGEPYGR